jgi:phosphatidylethanolamine-binding protein (PEBP) family uncharacterized protein
MSPRWLGRLLQSRRADASLSVWNELDCDQEFALSSPAFNDGDPIPRRHAAKGVGDNVSPALEWSGVPAAANHLVFVLEDTDVPFERPLIHTLSIIDPDATALPEGALAADSPAVEHVPALGRRGYYGPRPIVGHGTHRYGFMLFAVDGDIDTSSQRAAVASMRGHVVGRARIVGTYER